MYAQNTLSTSDILASAKQQYVLGLQQKRVSFLKESTYKLPLVDEIEFRTETNDFRLKEQQYVLRGRFHTKLQQQAHADFHQAKIELNTIDEQLLMQDLLIDRYDAIIKVSYFKKLLVAKKEQKVLLEDRMTVLKKSINLPRFNVIDLIDAEDDLHLVDRDILKLKNSLNLVQQEIYRFSSKRGYLKTDDLQLIGVEQLIEPPTHLTDSCSTRLVLSCDLGNDILNCKVFRVMRYHFDKTHHVRTKHDCDNQHSWYRHPFLMLQ